MMEGQSILDRILRNRALTHVLFWLGVLLVAPFTSDPTITDVKEAFLFRAVALPPKIVATYWLVYFLIPTFLSKGRILLFIMAFSVSTVILAYLYRLNNVYVAETLAGLPHPKEPLGQMIREFWYTVLAYFPRLYFFAIVFWFVKAAKDRYTQRHRIALLEKEKAEAELRFLKAQIHPHFLFNTLNNLYVLTLDKSDQAPEVVAKLSDILDYMLYVGRSSRVPIQKEIDLLNNYIDLEKLRYGDRLELTFNRQIDQPDTRIAPLILLSLVENAFKHGVSDTRSKAEIRINLSVTDGDIHCRVFNTKPEAPSTGFSGPSRSIYSAGNLPLRNGRQFLSRKKVFPTTFT
jgi:two-component system, LytTR family, sensor kinase